jgi:hypothetical protein
MSLMVSLKRRLDELAERHAAIQAQADMLTEAIDAMCASAVAPLTSRHLRAASLPGLGPQL